ncbi:hypothetical protein JW905_03205 [bacterium]|nr:hypothetical protein [candidate division CSSED10-310 bacterium]
MKLLKSETARTVALVCITAVIALAIVWVNTYQRCRREYLAGEQYFEQQEHLKAITAYETAIHAYTPWNGMIPASARRLWEIALEREHNGDVEMALIALRSLRSSFYAVRSLYTPYPEWIRRSEAKIDELVALQNKGRWLDKRAPESAPVPE